jgi:2-oxoglutarate ferredoxin oxidoreductase subunit beta
MRDHFAAKYLRVELLPTSFCPGCGNGIVMNAFLKAVEELGYEDLKEFVFVSGIGCSSWIPNPYFKADSIHTLHGRAIPVALGLKLSRPELNVVVIAGDGDIASIGLEHLIHAARRNADLLVLMVNNMIYGMTGGQQAPTTPLGFETSTTPYGNIEKPLDACALVATAGANYSARWTVAHFHRLKESIKKAMGKRGFRFIEAVSPCTSHVVRRLKIPVSTYIKQLREESVLVGAEEGMGKIVIGEYADRDEEGFIERMYKYINRLRG